MLYWDELQYAEFQYESGLAYLNFYIPNDAMAVDAISRSSTYWRWWINQWNKRDEQFLDTAFLSIEARLAIYTELHDARTLAAEIYPNGVVLADSYKAMIGSYIKQEVL